MIYALRAATLGVGLALVACATGSTAAPEWEIAAPESAGVDVAALRQLTVDIREGDYANVHSVLVVRDGKLVYEEYFRGADERRGTPVGEVTFDADTAHDARSVTKSVVSVLFGIAVAEGRITDLNAPVLDYFPQYADLRTPERLAIRLRDVLSMTSGFAWDEGSRPYGDPANNETQMDGAPDPYRYVLERPIAAAPGTAFEYSGGDTMLLAGVIERATGMSLQDYSQRVLFTPLGMEGAEWLAYPGGVAIAASGLRLRPRDMAKIGQMYLDGGRWRGVQIVPETWVRDSLSPHAVVSNRPLGFQRYGYQWWLGTARVGETMVPYSVAVGWGGQRVLIVPSMNVVVVMTCGLYGDPRQTDITFEVMLDRVLPAIAG